MSTYYHSNMKKKEDMFAGSYIPSTSDYDYESWQKKLEEVYWQRICDKYAENYQYALLRAMTVVGVTCYKWKDVFSDVCNEYSCFKGLSKELWERNSNIDWLFFAKKITSTNAYYSHFPTHYPEWLLEYGYSQRQYLSDLAVYWDDIHDDYYKPWPGVRVGEDSPPVARLKKLGDAARREIDKVSQHANRRL